MKKYFLFILLLPGLLWSQQDSFLALIQSQMTLVNPAHAGTEGYQTLTFVSRSQWNNISSAPKTIALTYSKQGNKNLSMGFSVLSDKVFIESQVAASVDFSYQLKMSDDAMLMLGIKAGMNSYQADLSNLVDFDAQIDPSKVALSRWNPNFGVGAYFQNNALWVSASIPRLFNTRRSEEISLQARDQPHFYLSSGYQIDVNSSFALEPLFIYRTAKQIPSLFEGVLWGSFKNDYRLGIGMRTGNIFTLKTSIRVNKNIQFNYAYDSYGSSQLNALQLNAHEIGLKILFDRKKETPEEEAKEQI